MSHAGAFQGSLSPGLSKNALLRIAQHRAHHALASRCALAKQFVIGKLSNQRTMLQRVNHRLTDSFFEQEIDQMAVIVRQLAALPIEDESAPRLVSGDSDIQGTCLEQILGLEGAGSAVYFGCFGRMLSDQQQWPFAGRVKRPPTDPVNALLSYGYTLLTNRVMSAVQIISFDPYIGYLHSSAYGSPVLALDLMEEFRALIVDSIVFILLNKRMLSRDDFEVEVGAYRLKKEPRKLFLTRFEERLHEQITPPIFGYKTTYRHCLELQARLLAKYLTGEIGSYPPLMMR